MLDLLRNKYCTQSLCGRTKAFRQNKDILICIYN